MEVVIALALLLGISLPMSYLLGTVLQQTSDARASVAAGLIAEQQLEEAHSILSAAMTAGVSSVCTPRNGTGPDLPCTVPEASQTVQGIAYNVSLYFQWTSISGTADVCTSGQIPQVVLAQVTVSWGPTLRSVSQSSVVNLPYIATNPLNGFLAVQVNDAAGTGSQGVLVTATNTSPSYTNSGLTDSHGCAFLTVPSASPGYTVTLSPPTSTAVYVDQTNNPSPSQANEAVSTQGITTVAFQYDQAATVNLNYPSVTGVADGITCPTSAFCLASGQGQTPTASATTSVNGVTTAQLFSTTNGVAWNNVSLPGMARLLGISCASTSVCEGVGTGTAGNGAAIGATITAGNWTTTAQALPGGVSELSGVACTSAISCYAVGYGVSGATRTGVMLFYNGVAWAKVTTSGVGMIQSVACPSAATCIIAANNTATPVVPQVFTFNTVTAVFSPITITPTPTTLSSVTCGTSALCILTGTAAGNAEAWLSADSGTTWLSVGGIPGGTSTLTSPVCLSTSSCLVLGNSPTTTSAQVLRLTGAPAAGPTAWTAATATLPSGVQSLSDLACSTATNCVAAGQISGSPTQGLLMTSTNAGSTWTSTSVPGSTTSTFLTGVGCIGTTCVASGEAPTTDLLYGMSGSTWQVDTDPAPSTVDGLLGAGWSASVGNTNLNPYPFKEIAASASGPVTPASPNPTVLTPLFPFASGYTVWPGGCGVESISPPSVAVNPGGTSTAQISLASVALQIVDTTGQPVPGATVTLIQANPASAHCPNETFAMPTTAADGLSRAGFSYGVYTISISNPMDAKVTTTTITVGSSSVVNAGGVTYPDPDPVVVGVS